MRVCVHAPSTRGHLSTLTEEMGLTGFTRFAMFKCLSLVAGGFPYPAGVGGGTGGVAGAGGAKGPKPGRVSASCCPKMP